MSARPGRLLLGITDPTSAVLIRGQLAWLRAAGWDVTLLCGPGEAVRRLAEQEGVRLAEVPMAREISPPRDLASLVRVTGVLLRTRPDVVNAGTAKAGLLVMVAAWLTRVPGRVYTMRGLRLETTTGTLRRVLWAVERLTCALSTRVVCVSPSLRARAVELGVVPAEKTVVIGGGSSNGVDVARFAPTPRVEEEATAWRARLGLDADAPVVGFVGRLVRDKGIRELAQAWTSLRERFPAARLLLVGPAEEGDPVDPEVIAALRADPRVAWAGSVPDPAPLYRLMRLLVLPTYREGFPNVVLEASASGLPTVATRVPGCVDAVAEGRTGLLVPARDGAALANAIGTYLADPALARAHGDAARARVETEFGRERIWRGLADLYDTLRPSRGRPRPAVGA